MYYVIPVVEVLKNARVKVNVYKINVNVNMEGRYFENKI